MDQLKTFSSVRRPALLQSEPARQTRECEQESLWTDRQQTLTRVEFKLSPAFPEITIITSSWPRSEHSTWAPQPGAFGSLTFEFSKSILFASSLVKLWSIFDFHPESAEEQEVDLWFVWRCVVTVNHRVSQLLTHKSINSPPFMWFPEAVLLEFQFLFRRKTPAWTFDSDK